MALQLNPPTQRTTLLHFTIGATWPSAADTWRCSQPLIAGTTVIPHHALPAKFLRAFPDGFRDETYLAWERDYKWDAHQKWERFLNRAAYRALLREGDYVGIAHVRLQSRHAPT